MSAMIRIWSEFGENNYCHLINNSKYRLQSKHYLNQYCCNRIRFHLHFCNLLYITEWRSSLFDCLRDTVSNGVYVWTNSSSAHFAQCERDSLMIRSVINRRIVFIYAVGFKEDGVLLLLLLKSSNELIMMVGLSIVRNCEKSYVMLRRPLHLLPISPHFCRIWLTML